MLNSMPNPAEEFIRCPTCKRKFANAVSFEAHRSHGRCVDPADLGQLEMFGIFWIAGSAQQVNDWIDGSPTAEPAPDTADA